MAIWTRRGLPSPDRTGPTELLNIAESSRNIVSFDHGICKLSVHVSSLSDSTLGNLWTDAVERKSFYLLRQSISDIYASKISFCVPT